MFAKHSLLVVLSRFILYRFSDIVHAQTQAVSSYLADKIGVSWNRLHVIPNSINFLESKAPLLSSARSFVGSSSSNEFTLFCVGNKFDQKGFDIAVSLAKFSWNHSMSLSPGPLLTFEVYGQSNTDSILADSMLPFNELLDYLPLPPNITFFGHKQEPFSCQCKDSIFFLCSRFEGFPMLYCVFAAGHIVFALNFHYISELDHLENLYLIDPGNIEYIFNRILSIISDLHSSPLRSFPSDLSLYTDSSVFPQWEELLKLEQ